MMADHKHIPIFANFVLAGLSGVGATMVSFPLDVLKTRLQLIGEGKKGASMTTFQLAKEIMSKEGVMGFYSGLSASCLRQATYTGVRMGAFQSLVDYFDEGDGHPPNLFVKSGCGVISGAMGGVAGLPADVALTRMANDGSLPPEKRRNYTSVFNAVIRMYREEGFLTLFRGLSPTVVRAMIVNISQLVSYSQAKETLLKYDIMQDNTLCHVTCSIFSAFVATTFVLPPDIAKTRMQNMAVVNGIPEYSGMINTWVKIVTKEGFFALWKGFTPLLARNGPQFLVFFIIYENLSYVYKKFILKNGRSK